MHDEREMLCKWHNKLIIICKCMLLLQKYTFEQHTMHACCLIGCPMLDFIVKAKNRNLFDKYQLNDDFHHVDDSSRMIFNDLDELAVERMVGGSVTNTARILKWISGETIDVSYYGALGDDANGMIIRNRLEEEGIRCVFKVIENVETARCAVLVDEDKRTLVTDLGAAKFYRVDDLIKDNSLEKADYIYVSTLFYGVCPETMDYLAQLSEKRNKKLVLNLGAAFLPLKYPQIKNAFLTSHIVIGNVSELHAMKQLFNITSNDSATIALEMNAMGQENRLLIITNGDQALFICEAKRIRYFEVNAVEMVQDTNGAGDAFVGGFLGRYITSNEIESSVAYGLWAASEIVQNTGCNFDPTKSFFASKKK